MNSKKTKPTPVSSKDEEVKVTKPTKEEAKVTKAPKAKPSSKKPSVKPKIHKVTIQSLAVGARFVHEGILFRKAFPVNKTHQVGQKLVKAQFSDTLLLGTARSFESETLVEPK